MLVEDAKANGAVVHAGGAPIEGTAGYFYQPTILTGVKEGTRIVDEEQVRVAPPATVLVPPRAQEPRLTASLARASDRFKCWCRGGAHTRARVAPRAPAQFGPALPIMSYKDEDEAIARANDVRRLFHLDLFLTASRMVLPKILVLTARHGVVLADGVRPGRQCVGHRLGGR